MRNLIKRIVGTCLIVASAAGAFGLAHDELHEDVPTQIAVVLPYMPVDSAAESAQDLLDILFDHASPDTQIVIFDGGSAKWLSTVIIPRNKNTIGRDKEIQEQLGGVHSFFTGGHSTTTGKSSIVNVPEMVSVVADHINGSGEGTRLIFVGSPYSYPGEDPNAHGTDRFSWTVGQVLSDGHGMARLSSSPWGTAGREDELKGLCVDFVCTMPRGSVRTMEPVERFFANYFQGLGAELSTFTTDPAAAAMNALNGSRTTNSFDPWNELDSELRVWDLNDRYEAEKRWQGTPPIAAVFMVDGTPSMSSYQNPFRTVGFEAAELMARTAPETSLALTVFSKPGSFTSMPMTAIGSSNKWASTAGLAEAKRFLSGPAFTDGGSTADVEGVLMDAFDKLEASDADRYLIWIVLDVGPFEMDRQSDVSAADNAAEARCKQRMSAFVREHPDTRIVMTYLGSEAGQIGERSIAFCKAMVKIGARHSVVTRSFVGIEPVLSRAAIAD